MLTKVDKQVLVTQHGEGTSREMPGNLENKEGESPGNLGCAGLGDAS